MANPKLQIVVSETLNTVLEARAALHRMTVSKYVSHVLEMAHGHHWYICTKKGILPAQQMVSARAKAERALAEKNKVG